jgi:hypothetical protein
MIIKLTILSILTKKLIKKIFGRFVEKINVLRNVGFIF